MASHQSRTCQSHFLLIPLMSQGHLLPAVDIARLLAERNVLVTIVTTPVNAARVSNVTDRAIGRGLPIQIFQVRFPSTEVGLPEGCETTDALPSRDLFKNFFTAIKMMQGPVEKLFSDLNPRPSCIVSGKYFPWTAETASKFRIPRILFDGKNFFSLLCSHNLRKAKVHERVPELESFVVPGLPDKIEFTKAQLPGDCNSRSKMDLQSIREQMAAAEAGAHGILVNSFQELEAEYIKRYEIETGKKVWCIGPVSLCNREKLDKAQRGNNASSDNGDQYLNWLDLRPPNSVIYACFGSLNRLTPPQLIELGRGLEATNRPFIWAIRGGYKREEMEKWLEEDGFEERVKARGLLIRGWAPQLLILSHPAIGVFLTHCGWNSTLEGICAGVPMVTWPMFAEQFFNAKLVTQVFKIGVPVGAEVLVPLGEEEKFGVLVKKEQVKEAIEKVMNEDKHENRRKEARKLAELSKMAVEEGGTSYHSITLLIEDFSKQSNNWSQPNQAIVMSTSAPNSTWHQSSSEASSDNSWYLDSGATDHVTSDFNKLDELFEYHGDGFVRVADNYLVPVAHIGSGFISVPHPFQSLVLGKILYAPAITESFLSISQLTKDNDIIVEFSSEGCVIRDKDTNTQLLQGQLSRGLYRLLLHDSTSTMPLSEFSSSTSLFSTVLLHCTTPII